jgi:hypothetical protein
MMPEACSEGYNLEKESREDREETRKELVDWKKLKLEAEIRDLLSSDCEENEWKEERRM